MTQPIDDSPRALIARTLEAAGVPADTAMGYAELICQQFAGEEIYFATRSWTDVTTRNETIRAQRRSGRSWGWLAREYSMSRAGVRRICEQVAAVGADIDDDD
jgi:Mor family transcriptional regulator